MNEKNTRYTLDYAFRDSQDRNHILNELQAIKIDFGISKMRILELGCGVGHNLSVFASDNIVKGVEGVPSIAEQARLNGLTIDSYDLNLGLLEEDASWDVVLCLDVLEHLIDPLGCISEIARILNKNGFAILNVPNHFNLSGRLKIMMGSSLDVHGYFPNNDEWNNPHLRFFTFDGFRRMIHIAGFEILEDRSNHFATIPYLSKYLFPQSLSNMIAHASPALFSGGFFIVVQVSSSSKKAL